MKMRLLTCVIVPSLLLIGLTAQASAQSIGINFSSAKNVEKSTLADDATAGINAAKQTHWNNLRVSNSDANGHSNSGHLLEVVDDQGKAVDSTTVQVKGDKTHQVWSTNGSSWGFKGDNLTLQSGQLHYGPMITVADVPYKKYDVIVYISAGNSGGIGQVNIAKANNVAGEVSGDKTYFVNYQWASGQFKQATATTLDDAKSAAAGNYVVFSGITASDFTITFNGKVVKGWLGVSAIQIVQAK
ncbi:MAG: hypothetical protein CMJ19_17495 [Phycisphaeraceae bacterium]|nr:hypothetical protein [Phycisphaeraceae bacterium]